MIAKFVFRSQRCTTDCAITHYVSDRYGKKRTETDILLLAWVQKRNNCPLNENKLKKYIKLGKSMIISFGHCICENSIKSCKKTAHLPTFIEELVSNHVLYIFLYI